MHMYVARKNVRENREITLILKGEMSFATETSLGFVAELLARCLGLLPMRLPF